MMYNVPLKIMSPRPIASICVPGGLTSTLSGMVTADVTQAPSEPSGF